MLRYTIDRARPGLVAFYDIRPGNGAGLFLQPRNPHWAHSPVVGMKYTDNDKRGVLIIYRLLQSGTILISFKCHCMSCASVIIPSLQCLSPRAGSGVVRMDPLRFLAGCRTRRLNQA